MPWRNWSIVVVLILGNYIIFSLLGSYAFPSNPDSLPTHTVQPTFTPGGVRALTQLPPLTYPFLTPGASTSGTTIAITATQTITVTRPPAVGTTSPGETGTLRATPSISPQSTPRP